MGLGAALLAQLGWRLLVGVLLGLVAFLGYDILLFCAACVDLWLRGHLAELPDEPVGPLLLGLGRRKSKWQPAARPAELRVAPLETVRWLSQQGRRSPAGRLWQSCLLSEEPSLFFGRLPWPEWIVFDYIANLGSLLEY